MTAAVRKPVDHDLEQFCTALATLAVEDWEPPGGPAGNPRESSCGDHRPQAAVGENDPARPLINVETRGRIAREASCWRRAQASR